MIAQSMVLSKWSSIDWLVLIAYVTVLLTIGWVYNRRNKTTEQYLLADRKMSPFLAGISLYATMFSVLSFVGYPGEIIQNGPTILIGYFLSLPIIYLLVGYLIIPFFMKVRITSAYELLEERLGPRVRTLGSGIFLLTRFFWMALMLYTTSMVAVTTFGWPEHAAIWISLVVGGFTAVYTILGGFGAVVVSDVFQFFVLLIGVVLTLVLISAMTGGVAPWWPSEWPRHWAPQPLLSFDPTVRVTIAGSMLSGILWWICTAASDQMAVQRYISTKDVKTARKAFLFNSFADVSLSLALIMIGLALMGFYLQKPEVFPVEYTLNGASDKFFPYFIGNFLPVGMGGLLTAGILAATMSSVSSGLNASATLVMTDFIERSAPNLCQSEQQKLRLIRGTVLVLAVSSVVGSQLMAAVPGNIIEVAGRTVNLFICPLFGLFFLAFFVPFATPFGAVMGAIYSLFSAVLIGYWSQITLGAELSFQWIAPVAFVVTIAFSCLFSLFPTRGRSTQFLILSGLLSLMPLILIVLYARNP